ncbi:hypothetical protein GYA28_02565 [Candidatus Roizmanbacteria bacterium]|nr:hypothetical protein [Candidatus Roizmanbacteria bacterium]
MKTLSFQLTEKMNEVFLTKPADLGFVFLTHWYKRFTSIIKTAPFIIIVPLSLLFSLLTYLVFGYLLVKLTSILQYGF